MLFSSGCPGASIFRIGLDRIESHQVQVDLPGHRHQINKACAKAEVRSRLRQMRVALVYLDYELRLILAFKTSSRQCQHKKLNLNVIFLLEAPVELCGARTRAPRR